MAETLLDITTMHSDDLITRAREGDKNAQGKLVQLWYKRIYNFSFKFFFDHDLAMEAAQKTFISMHRNLGALQEISRFKSWLYSIAVNCCREEVRKKKTGRAISLDQVHQHFNVGNSNWEISGHRHEDPERQLRHSELTDILHKCLMEISQEQREVVIMKEYEGLKFREIALILKVSENTVKSRMYYGLDGLKKVLHKKKITKETIGYGI